VQIRGYLAADSSYGKVSRHGYMIGIVRKLRAEAQLPADVGPSEDEDNGGASGRLARRLLNIPSYKLEGLTLPRHS
jgi:hypothetical protein